MNERNATIDEVVALVVHADAAGMPMYQLVAMIKELKKPEPPRAKMRRRQNAPRQLAKRTGPRMDPRGVISRGDGG